MINALEAQEKGDRLGTRRALWRPLETRFSNSPSWPLVWTWETEQVKRW